MIRRIEIRAFDHDTEENLDLGEISHEVPLDKLWEAIKAEPEVGCDHPGTVCFDAVAVFEHPIDVDGRYTDGWSISREKVAALIEEDLDDALTEAGWATPAASTRG